MSDLMIFPETVDEFMEDYKVIDTEEVYTNGTELVPIFRMKQWFEAHEAIPVEWINHYIDHVLYITWFGEYDREYYLNEVRKMITAWRKENEE